MSVVTGRAVTTFQSFSVLLSSLIIIHLLCPWLSHFNCNPLLAHVESYSSRNFLPPYPSLSPSLSQPTVRSAYFITRQSTKTIKKFYNNNPQDFRPHTNPVLASQAKPSPGSQPPRDRAILTPHVQPDCHESRQNSLAKSNFAFPSLFSFLVSAVLALSSSHSHSHHLFRHETKSYLASSSVSAFAGIR